MLDDLQYCSYIVFNVLFNYFSPVPPEEREEVESSFGNPYTFRRPTLRSRSYLSFSSQAYASRYLLGCQAIVKVDDVQLTLEICSPSI